MAKRKCKLINGKFYLSYGGNAHPSQIYEKTKQGTYRSIKTGTTESKDTISLKPIQKGVKRQFVNKRPFEGTRKDYGDRDLLGLSFDPADTETLEAIKQRRPRLTKSARKAYKKMPPSD